MRVWQRQRLIAGIADGPEGDRLFPVLERIRGLIQTEFVRLGMWAMERQFL
jgi:hypothetical protein